MNNINGKDLSRLIGCGKESEKVRSRQHQETLETDAVCVDCIISNCMKKGRGGYLRGCPNDPEQLAYLEEFRRRYSGKQIK
ncbi:MAG TPA: hypothetical protein PLV50_14340 [Smithella sp.]|jgi:hypothetical protein|nr:hypothetical protein [Candidatus Moranbacteria bacterium]HOG91719.1 hypothetical protein [Smithella sp.]HPM11318.1 hypothetical protein [Paludibacter sp.]